MSTAPLIGGNAEAFQHMLARYARFVHEVGQVPLTQQGLIYKSALKRLLQALQLPHDRAGEGMPLLFMRYVLTAIEELSVQRGRGSYLIHTPSGFFREPIHQRIRRVFDAWVEGRVWHELHVLGHNQALFTSDHLAHAPSLQPFRQAVVTALAALGRDATPFNAQEVLRWLGQHHPTVLLQHAAHTNPRFFHECGVLLPRRSPQLARIDALLVAHILECPLHWMGVLASEGGQGCWRLTSAGCWLVGLDSLHPSAQATGRLIVQPNFTILVMPPADESLLTDLEGVAVFQGGDPALSYQITRESFYAAQAEGWSAADVIRLLEKHQGGALPANVKRTLTEWEAAHRRIVLRPSVCVVQTADAATSAEVLATLAPLHAQPLSERFLILPAAQRAAVQDKLRAEGWQLVSSGDGPSPHLVFYAAREARLITPLPDLYVLAQLQQLGQLHTNDAEALIFRLDRAAVQRAAQERGGVAVRQFLRTIHQGPLPKATEHLIEHWTRFYGRATIRALAVIEVAQPQVMREILNDPELRALVQAINPDLRLLSVHVTHLPALKRLLAERGMELEDETTVSVQTEIGS
ncbi:MAG: helicase-associated domain-containing protein [Thermoflexales bacterium]